MAGYDNIKDHRFDKRTADEQREIAIAGGKASGAARRKKAKFRETLNQMLTTKVDIKDWTPFLEAMGLDSTLEAAVNAAMIREALAGNVKAYEAIARYSGQSDRTDAEQRNVDADTRMKQARADMEEENAKIKAQVNEEPEVIDDGFLDALKGTAAEDWSDEET